MGKVLITVNLSFEYSLRRDIKDYLFFHDRNVEIKGTEYRGVFIIESSKDPVFIATILINSPIPENALTTIVPITMEGLYSNLDDLIDKVRKNISGNCGSFIVRCRLRGSHISNEMCEEAIINLLRSQGFHAMFRGDADCAIIIEGLSNWFGAYIGPRASVRV
ncbi:MAG: hypothetical protein ACP5NQ_01055 [Vulcanisaeta sp.]